MNVQQATTVSRAADLGIRTTAEGIETAQEMEQMRALGCGQLQGYLFSKPSASPSADQSNVWAQPQPTEFIPEALAQRRSGAGGR